ncbi:polysaccharide pyruvyl transferase family protein [Vibrio cholerae]
MSYYNVVLRGAYGAYNFGDDALLDVVYSSVINKVPPKEIAIFGSSCSYLRKIYPNSAVIDKFEAANTVCQYLVFGGGTQFYDFGKKSGLYQKLSLIKKPEYIFKKILSKKTLPIKSKNDIYLAVGLGPFQERSKILKDAQVQMASSKFVSVRDETSLSFLKEAHIDAIKTVDLCFSKNLSEFIKVKTGFSKIGIILRDWDFYDSEYCIEKLKNQIDRLKLSYDVEIVSFGVDKNLKRRCTEYGYSLTSWDPEVSSINEFISKLASFDLIISSRYHGVIYSILLEIPVVALPIEPKLKIAASELDGVILYKNEGFCKIVDNIILNHKDIICRLSKTKEDNYLIAKETMNKFVEVLL